MVNVNPKILIAFVDSRPRVKRPKKASRARLSTSDVALPSIEHDEDEILEGRCRFGFRA